MTIGALPTKASTYVELTSFAFLKNQPKILKSSKIKGIKSSFWSSSYQNHRLFASNLQNQSVTDKQTNKQTGRPRALHWLLISKSTTVLVFVPTPNKKNHRLNKCYIVNSQRNQFESGCLEHWEPQSPSAGPSPSPFHTARGSSKDNEKELVNMEKDTHRGRTFVCRTPATSMLPLGWTT